MVSQLLKSRGALRGLIPWSWGFPGLQRKLQWTRKCPEDWSCAQCMSTAREREVRYWARIHGCVLHLLSLLWKVWGKQRSSFL